MKKKNSERRKRGVGKKSSSKNSVAESYKKKKSSHSVSESVRESPTTSWNIFARIFSCTSGKSHVVESAHNPRNLPESPPKKSEESPPKTPDQKLPLQNQLNINTFTNIDILAPSSPQQEWTEGDEQKEIFPTIDDDCSVAASELTMDTFFRNQENSSHNSRDRTWSSFLGFGSQHQMSPPTSPSHQQNQQNQLGERSSSFFGLGGYGYGQNNGMGSNRLQGPNGSNSSDAMEDPAVEGSVSQQSQGVKPTRLQQQQASLLMRTQRSMRNSTSGNNTPLVDPLARPGSFRAMRQSVGTPSPRNQNSARAAVTSPPSTALMMVDTGGDMGNSDTLCDIYPNQEDQMFEEMKYGINSSGGAGKVNDGSVFKGKNPAMGQMKNHMNNSNNNTNSNMNRNNANNRSGNGLGSRAQSMMTTSTTPSNVSDFYVSSTDDGYSSVSNSLSPKSPLTSRSTASSFSQPAPMYRSQSTPIQSMQQNNNSNTLNDSPSVSKGSTYKEPYSNRKPNSNGNGNSSKAAGNNINNNYSSNNSNVIDMQNPTDRKSVV